MARGVAAALALLLVVAPGDAFARGHGRGHSSSSANSSHGSSSYRSSGSSHHSTSTHRTSHGKAKRDPEQRRAFIRSHPCPSTGKTGGTCPGYTVDHVTPLKRGGADAPGNMQWQTVQAAKAKDKWE